MVEIIRSVQANTGSGSTLSIPGVEIKGGEELWVGVISADGSVANSTSPVISSVKFGNQTMTQVRTDVCLSDNAATCTWFYLANPDVGIFTVTITAQGGCDHGISGFAYSVGGGQHVAADANTGANNTSGGNPVTNSITTITDNTLVIDLFIASSSGETITMSGSFPQVQLFNVKPSSPMGSSYQFKPSHGSASFSWNVSNTARGWAWSVVAIKPAANYTKKLNNYMITNSTGNVWGMNAERRT